MYYLSLLPFYYSFPCINKHLFSSLYYLYPQTQKIITNQCCLLAILAHIQILSYSDHLSLSFTFSNTTHRINLILMIGSESTLYGFGCLTTSLHSLLSLVNALMSIFCPTLVLSPPLAKMLLSSSLPESPLLQLSHACPPTNQTRLSLTQNQPIETHIQSDQNLLIIASLVQIQCLSWQQLSHIREVRLSVNLERKCQYIHEVGLQSSKQQTMEFQRQEGKQAIEAQLFSQESPTKNQNIICNVKVQPERSCKIIISNQYKLVCI